MATKQEGPCFTEAPVSVNIKVDLDGFDVLVTFRGENQGEMLAQLPDIIAGLKDLGAKPKPAYQKGGGGWKGGGSYRQNRPPQGTDASAPTCPTHGPMRPSNKPGLTHFCPGKMPDGSYCRYVIRQEG